MADGGDGMGTSRLIAMRGKSRSTLPPPSIHPGAVTRCQTCTGYISKLYLALHTALLHHRLTFGTGGDACRNLRSGPSRSNHKHATVAIPLSPFDSTAWPFCPISDANWLPCNWLCLDYWRLCVHIDRSPARYLGYLSGTPGCCFSITMRRAAPDGGLSL